MTKKTLIAAVFSTVVFAYLAPPSGAQNAPTCPTAKSCEQAFSRCKERRAKEGLTKLNCEWSFNNCNRTCIWDGGKFTDGTHIYCKVQQCPKTYGSK